MKNKLWKGAIAEHIAIAALLTNHYRVFKYDFNDGDVDLIAEKGNTMYRMQVKAMFYSQDKKKKGADVRKKKGKYSIETIDAFLIVDVETSEVFWLDVSEVKTTAVYKRDILNHRIYPIESIEVQETDGQPATNAERLRSKPAHNKNKTSQYKGVSYMVRQQKWRASIYNNGKYKHIGLYASEIDAAQAYDDYVAISFPSTNAYLNFRP